MNIFIEYMFALQTLEESAPITNRGELTRANPS